MTATIFCAHFVCLEHFRLISDVHNPSTFSFIETMWRRQVRYIELNVSNPTGPLLEYSYEQILFSLTKFLLISRDIFCNYGTRCPFSFSLYFSGYFKKNVLI